MKRLIFHQHFLMQSPVREILVVFDGGFNTWREIFICEGCSLFSLEILWSASLQNEKAEHESAVKIPSKEALVSHQLNDDGVDHSTSFSLVGISHAHFFPFFLNSIYF